MNLCTISSCSSELSKADSVEVIAFPIITVEDSSYTYIENGGSYIHPNTIDEDTSEILTFYVKNIGDADLDLTGTPKHVSILDGAFSDYFSLSQNPGSPVVASGGINRFKIQVIVPEGVGDIADEGNLYVDISIANSDEDRDPYVVRIIIPVNAYIITANSGNIWMFGGEAGLLFSSTDADAAPTHYTDSVMTQGEGTFVLSDGGGNLILYTNGKEVYNNAHARVKGPDGVTDVTLKGNGSASTSALAATIPGTNIYHIFTADAKNGGNHYNHNIFDPVALSGDGQVTLADRSLDLVTGDFGSGTASSECIGLIQHANGTDWWVLFIDLGSPLAASTDPKLTSILLDIDGLHCGSAFYAAAADKTGLADGGSAPTQYTLGSGGSFTIVNTNGTTKYTTCYFIKESPNGEKVAITNGNRNNPKIMLADFNNSTGALSNQAEYEVNASGSYNSQVYSAEFSPDSSKLFFSFMNFSGVDDCCISILDLSTCAADNTGATRPAGYDRTWGKISSPANNPSDIQGGMQLAKDGKIYIAKNGTEDLIVIEDPDNEVPGTPFASKATYALESGKEAKQGINYVPKSFILNPEWLL